MASQSLRPPHRHGPSSLTSNGNSNGNNAGAADAELFMRSFEDVPRIEVHSSTEMVSILAEITNTLEDTSKDWEKIVECLRRVRSLISSGYSSRYANEFTQSLIALPYETALTNLRSKVVNESCVTIAYISQSFGCKCDRFIEKLLHTLFKQIPNSAKFISTSAVVCITFIIQFTHSQRLIPVICSHMNDKSKAIRKAVCEFLDQLLHTWQTGPLEKHQTLLQSTLKKGLGDADSEARVSARRAFWGFAEHFRSQADGFLHQLDTQKQKLLYGEIGSTLLSSNSSSSLSHFLPGTFNGGVTTFSSGPRSLNYQSVQSSGYGPSNGSSRTRVGQRSRTSIAAGKSVSASNSIENLCPPQWSNRSSNLQNITGVSRSTINSQIALHKQLANGNGFTNSSAASNPVSGSRIAFGRKSITRRSVSASNSIENLTRPWSSMSGTNGTNGTYSNNGHMSAVNVLTFKSSRLSSLQLSGSKSKIPVFTPSPSKSNGSSPKEMANGDFTPPPPPPRPFKPLIPPDPISSRNSPPKTPVRPTSTISPSFLASFNYATSNTTSSTAANGRRNSDQKTLDCDDVESQLQRLQLDIQLHHEKEKQQEQKLNLCPPSSAPDKIDHAVQVLSPVINELPSSSEAIKTLTKLVKEQPNSVVIQLLPKVMPALVKAYDSPDISVRKAAVFAMVSIHNAIGFDSLAPFLVELNPSKMKLLKLYISRSS